MKRFLVLFLSLILMFLASCAENGQDTIDNASSQPESVGEESSEAEFPTENKKLLWKTTVKNQAGVIESETIYEYDEFGRESLVTTVSSGETTRIHYEYDQQNYIIKEEQQSKSGKVLSYTEYDRDEEGYILSMRKYNSAGMLKNELKYEYIRNENGKITEVNCNGELQRTYSYEENGDYIMRNAWWDEESYAKCDSEGNILYFMDSGTESFYNYENGKLILFEQKVADVEYKTVYEYEGENLLSQTNYEDGEMSLCYRYEYDDEGFRIKSTMENALGIASSITISEYKNFQVRTDE